MERGSGDMKAAATRISAALSKAPLVLISLNVSLKPVARLSVPYTSGLRPFAYTYVRLPFLAVSDSNQLADNECIPQLVLL